MFINSLVEKCVGKSFEIDCVDIKIYLEDIQLPIFKGPGVIIGDLSGRLSYKIYNQIKTNEDIFRFINNVRENDEPEKTYFNLYAEDYKGVKWAGSPSIPKLNHFQLPYSLVWGKFDQLYTCVEKIMGDTTNNITELVYTGALRLPFGGAVKEKRFHDEIVISTSYWNDHHKMSFGNSSIFFLESIDHLRTNVKVTHNGEFSAPNIEKWLVEALIFITARNIYPRMVIHHYENCSEVSIKSTYVDTLSGMPSPFMGSSKAEKSTWEVFSAYLSKCKSSQKSEQSELTKLFLELIQASKGTLQGHLGSLAIYVEFCINQIFPSHDNGSQEDVEIFLKYVKDWKGDEEIKKRAEGLLSRLNSPSLPKKMDILIKEGVISEEHKEFWKSARNFLMHGKVIDFSSEDKYENYRNHLISMIYRLTFRLLAYKGFVLDYDGKNFNVVPFMWNEIC